MSTPRQIVCTPGMCGGSPRIDGTRLTCANVVMGILRCDGDIDAYLADYPDLTREDIRTCLAYCASRQCIADKPEHYCEHCILDDRVEDPPDAFIEDIGKAMEHFETGGTGHVFLGSREDWEREKEGMEMWVYAAAILKAHHW